MTPRQARAIIVCAACVITGVVAWSGSRLVRAHRDHLDALKHHTHTQQLWREVSHLRARTPLPRFDGLADRLRLLSREVSSGRAKGELSPLVAERTAPGVVAHRARLLVSPLRLPEAGELLQRLRESEPAWAIRSVELSPAAGGAMSNAGEQAPLRVAIQLEALLPAEKGP